MHWFWDRMHKHEDLVGALTGYSPVSSTYRFEAAIADAFDKLAERLPLPAPEGVEIEAKRDYAEHPFSTDQGRTWEGEEEGTRNIFRRRARAVLQVGGNRA
jgi:hypothetical protein